MINLNNPWHFFFYFVKLDSHGPAYCVAAKALVIDKQNYMCVKRAILSCTRANTQRYVNMKVCQCQVEIELNNKHVLILLMSNGSKQSINQVTIPTNRLFKKPASIEASSWKLRRFNQGVRLPSWKYFFTHLSSTWKTKFKEWKSLWMLLRIVVVVFMSLLHDHSCSWPFTCYDNFYFYFYLFFIFLFFLLFCCV